jgi:hypothetical protein
VEAVDIIEAEESLSAITVQSYNSYYSPIVSDFIVYNGVGLWFEEIILSRTENIGTRTLPFFLVRTIIIVSNLEVVLFAISLDILKLIIVAIKSKSTPLSNVKSHFCWCRVFTKSNWLDKLR